MQQSNGKLSSTAYADHLRGCADLSVEIARRMDIREDSARQACFATVIINAERHNIFMEPVPKDSKTPVIPPETVAAESRVPEKGVDRDAAAAEKADAQIGDVPKTTTPEMDEGARRSSFLAGIESARKLLNKLGHQPEITPAGLNTFIKKQFPPKTMLSSLDVDELEKLTKLLSVKLDEQRAKAKPETKTTDLEDWP